MPKETLDHLRSKKSPVSKTVYIAGDSDLAIDLNDMEREVSILELKVLRSPADSELAGQLSAKKEELEQLKTRMREASIKFRVQSIGRKKLEKLMSQHPPTETDIEQINKAKELAEAQGDDSMKNATLEWSPDTFPVALIAKSVVEPELTEQELTDWLGEDTWNQSEIQELFAAALEVNTTHRVVSLGKG